MLAIRGVQTKAGEAATSVCAPDSLATDAPEMFFESTTQSEIMHLKIQVTELLPPAIYLSVNTNLKSKNVESRR